MEYMCKMYYKSPIGLIEVVGINDGILSINFIDDGCEQNKGCCGCTKNPGKQYDRLVSNEDTQDNEYMQGEDMEDKNKKAIKHVNECIKQLDEYFSGERKIFHIDVILKGTEFQRKVWNALKDIPYGVTVSYAVIAEKIGNKKAVRAVGNANNKNPMSIIIPCHRVIGSDGSLTGYGGGLWRKKWLLEHEGAYMVK